MPRTKISEYSATPSENTDINGINIAENCPPSGINDAIRTLMADLKDWQSGASGDGLTVSTLKVTGAITFDTPLPVTSGGTGAASAGNAPFVERTSATGAAKIPSGDDSQRPGSPTAGMLRFNNNTLSFEGYNGAIWGSIGGGAGTGRYESKTVSSNVTLDSDTEYETGRDLVINNGAVLTIPHNSVLIVKNYANGAYF